ncbi:hypothetical protein E2C01_083532 [Portunus trituberculatus]|uniref:Uncharacterized protein n=1 Tax=Portunus trituberculatus TaxID=210409 RepID=A0A5B7J555_PORTR|nr:hypothetical protein [Portunus trituberculatus]
MNYLWYFILRWLYCGFHLPCNLDPSNCTDRGAQSDEGDMTASATRASTGQPTSLLEPTTD